MKTIKKGKIVEATCDNCGADCMIPLFKPMKSDGDRDNHDIAKEFEGMELSATWGYGSKHDGEKWNAILCENCVDKILKSVNFEKKMYL